MNLRRLLVFVPVLVFPLPSAVHALDYEFDGTITRTTLENYLSRSITMQDLLTGHGNLDDNIRMLKNVGAKFAGRTIYLWGGESQLPTRLAEANTRSKAVPHGFGQEETIRAIWSGSQNKEAAPPRT